jgi:hypothetical protein
VGPGGPTAGGWPALPAGQAFDQAERLPFLSQRNQIAESGLRPATLGSPWGGALIIPFCILMAGVLAVQTGKGKAAGRRLHQGTGNAGGRHGRVGL